MMDKIIVTLGIILIIVSMTSNFMDAKHTRAKNKLILETQKLTNMVLEQNEILLEQNHILKEQLGLGEGGQDE